MMSKGTVELQQFDKLKALAEISLKLNTILDLEPLLQTIIDIAADLLDCEAGSILLYDDEKECLFFAAATGAHSSELEHIDVPLDKSLAGAIFRTQKSVFVNDVSKDPRHFRRVEQMTDYHVRSLLGVPMSLNDRIIGVLEAINKRQAVFSSRDVQLLSIVASQAAVAINNARIVDELQEVNRELRRADQLKSDFLAVVSHELRTPLGLILGYGTFLKEETDSDLSMYADKIVKAVNRMTSLVEDMTDMKVIHRGSVEISPQPIPIQALLTNAYQDVAPLAKAKDVSLKFQAPSEKIWVAADTCLEKAFINLIDNAVRFSDPPGEIVVRVTKNEKQVGVAIKDDGVGIPPDSLERIFDQFYQVEDHLTREHGGLGLGLSIARSLVELHGGKIWAESPGLGKGSTFKVILPAVTP
jgi:signal transduction histidine kinase